MGETTMLFMLCRNRVSDFRKWKAIFDSHLSAHKAAGLDLSNLWQTVDDKNNVFFLFKVASIEKAKVFVNAPEAADAGKNSGVLEGECHFIESGSG